MKKVVLLFVLSILSFGCFANDDSEQNSPVENTPLEYPSEHYDQFPSVPEEAKNNQSQDVFLGNQRSQPSENDEDDALPGRFPTYVVSALSTYGTLYLIDKFSNDSMSIKKRGLFSAALPPVIFLSMVLFQLRVQLI